MKVLVCEKSPDLQVHLRQEIQYQRIPHQRDAGTRKDLYKVNRLSENDKVKNFNVLIGNNYQLKEEMIFPTDDKVVEKLTRTKTIEELSQPTNFYYLG